MLSLPIPDKQSPTRYEEIRWNEYDLGKIVSDLTNGRIQPSFFAHLDPDLNRESLPSLDGWLPALGQTDAAQGHLRNHGVGEGDLFLFYGLFREVEIKEERLIWKRNAPRRHVIWGWLQVGEVIAVDICDRNQYPWAYRHPHFHRARDKRNTLYVAKEALDLPNTPDRIPGAGIFPVFHKRLQLTEENSASPGQWRLPAWIYPDSGKPVLSYHGNMGRWERTTQCSRLKAVDRGQEFVLDCEYYPEAARWLSEILDT